MIFGAGSALPEGKAVMDANATQQFVPRMPPTVKQRARRSAISTTAYRIRRIRRKIAYRPWHALRLMATVALGVGLAIAIIAASEGINSKINRLLHSDDAASEQALQHAGINLASIQSVLIDTRQLLKGLAITYTTVTVGLVTWISLGQQRREIALDIQEGMYKWTVIIEIVVESFLHCLLGGLLGIAIGLGLCNLISEHIPLLPMSPSRSGVLSIFPATVVITFVTTTLVAIVFAHMRDATLDV